MLRFDGTAMSRAEIPTTRRSTADRCDRSAPGVDGTRREPGILTARRAI